MSGLIESAAAILSVSEHRIATAAHNIANVSTPGFKRQTGFEQLVARRAEAAEPQFSVRRDFSQASLAQTGNPLDFAISGAGFFQLRSGDTLLYSRQGQFRLAADGTVVSPQGYALQQAGGGDLVLDHAGVTLLDDGTVLDQGSPVARIAVYAASNETVLQPRGGIAFRRARGCDGGGSRGGAAAGHGREFQRLDRRRDGFDDGGAAPGRIGRAPRPGL